MQKMLRKGQVVAELKKLTDVGEGRIIFKVMDYQGNSLSPNKVAYRLHYSDSIGRRRRVTYFPGTVGFQWS